MPLWTNGRAHVVATGWGVARVEDESKEVTRYPTDKLKRDQDPPEIELFAVLDGEGQTALIRRTGESSTVWSAGIGFDPLEGPELLTATSTADGSLVVAATVGDRAVLMRAKVEDGQLTLGDRIEITAEQKLKWPSGVWSKSEETWPEEDEDREGEAKFDPKALSARSTKDAWLGRIRLLSNRCGVAVTSTYSGVVALLDATSLEPLTVVRVPTELESFDLFALPVPQGVLLTIVADRKQTEYVLIGKEGELVGHKHKLGKDLAWGAHSAGLLWADDKALISQALAGPVPFFMGLPGLTPKQFGKEESLVIESASSPDGSQHLVATTTAGQLKPQSWKLLQYDPNAKKVKGSEIPMPDFKPPPPPIAKPEKRKRAEGSPVLAMRPDQNTPWRAAVTESTALRLQVSNRGGPLAGMYVEIAGSAVSDALVAGEEATLGGVKGRFEKKGSAFRAELSDARVEAHFADATRADPAPSIELVVKLKAQRAGNALMTIRVGPIGATGISGSAMEGRSFIVAPGS